VIAFREKYPQRIKDAISKPVMDVESGRASFRSNPFYREQIDYQSLFKSQRNVVMLGNSLTFRMHWDELLDRADVANRGIGSDVIKGFYHRLDKVIELEPKICFIEGGANDIEFGVHLDTSFHYLNIIVDSLQGAGIIPVVTHVIFVTKDYPGSARFNLNAKVFNQKIDQLSQEKMVEMIDLNPVIAPRGYLENEFAQSDGIHLTSNAYTIWKQMVQGKLRKYKI
jgi:lysophospholipase L1-like esterase